jgi:hypothetical protein
MNGPFIRNLQNSRPRQPTEDPSLRRGRSVPSKDVRIFRAIEAEGTQGGTADFAVGAPSHNVSPLCIC